MNDRRRFSRIALRIPARLESPAGAIETQVLDVSLKGVLLALDDTWVGDTSERYRLAFELSPESRVEMELSLSHTSAGTAGFVCERIDLESLTHLRRIAEFNLGDPALLLRELEDLAPA